MQQQPPYGQPQYGGQQPPYAQQQGYGQQQMQPYQPPQPPGNPKLQEALTQVDLLAGEQIVYSLMADGFFLGAAPILKLIATIQAFMVTVTGGHIRIFLVVTNQRVLVIKSMQMWCGLMRKREVQLIALAGVKEVGSSKETQLCCINTRTVKMQSLTETFNLVVKKLPDQEIRSFVTNLSAVVVAHSSRASV